MYKDVVLQEVELRNRTVTSRFGTLQYPFANRKLPKLSTYRFPACGILFEDDNRRHNIRV